MTKSTITREQAEDTIEGLQELISRGVQSVYLDMAIAGMRQLLDAMDSEPHTDDELSNLLWYSQEAACHSDPNYYCEFQRLATPGFIAWIIRELHDRRNVEKDSEPVAWLLSGGGTKNVVCFDSGNAYADPLREVTPLYRHAQIAPEYPEVLPCPVLLEPGLRFGKGVKTSTMLAALARRAEHYAELEAMTPEERAEYDAGIEAFKVMLPQPAPQSPGGDHATVPGKWIPISEQMPEVGDIVLTAMGGVVNVGEMECSAANCRFFTSVISGRELPATHWMPLPAAPQGDK